MTIHRLIYILLAIFLCSCAKTVEDEVEIYNNDFKTNNLADISNGRISDFNGSKVLGNYNNGGFTLTINDLPKHNIVDISFDLFIHDNWEGNQQIQNQTAGPDIWKLVVGTKTYIYTTFSNIGCQPGNFCPPQSYPSDYPNNNNNPKSGASTINLPGFCSQASSATGTTLYKIHRSISHSEETLVIHCLDELKQKNVADPKCDESWSIDNIKVSVVNVK